MGLKKPNMCNKIENPRSNPSFSLTKSIQKPNSMAAKRIGGGKSGGGESGILAKISNSEIVSQGRRVAGDTVEVSKKLLWSTGKAAWISGTTFLILVVPLIIVMDREAQFNDLDLQQASLLGTPPTTIGR